MTAIGLPARRHHLVDLAQVLDLVVEPRRRRQLLLHQQHVDVGVGEHHLDALEIGLGARERREAGIERIAE